MDETGSIDLAPSQIFSSLANLTMEFSSECVAAPGPPDQFQILNGQPRNEARSQRAISVVKSCEHYSPSVCRTTDSLPHLRPAKTSGKFPRRVVMRSRLRTGAEAAHWNHQTARRSTSLRPAAFGKCRSRAAKKTGSCGCLPRQLRSHEQGNLFYATKCGGSLRTKLERYPS